MGLFIKNHQDYKSYVGNSVSNNPFNGDNINNSWAAQGIEFGANSLFTIMSKIGEGKGGVDGKGGKETDNIDVQAKIDAKNKELQGVFNECKSITNIEVTSTQGISSYINNINAIIYTEEPLVAGEKSSASIQDKINQYYNTDRTAKVDANGKELAPPGTSLDALEAQKKNAEGLEEDIRTKKLQIAKLEALYAKAENIELEIERIKDSSSSPEIKYDAEQETKDLNRFNNVLKSFPKNRVTQNDVNKLIKAFNGDTDNSESLVNQKHAIKAIELLKNANPKLDWSALKSV